MAYQLFAAFSMAKHGTVSRLVLFGVVSFFLCCCCFVFVHLLSKFETFIRFQLLVCPPPRSRAAGRPPFCVRVFELYVPLQHFQILFVSLKSMNILSAQQSISTSSFIEYMNARNSTNARLVGIFNCNKIMFSLPCGAVCVLCHLAPHFCDANATVLATQFSVNGHHPLLLLSEH